MRHAKKSGRKFGRVRKVRKGLIKSLIVALVLKEKIKTTEAKAKELAKKVSPFVTKAKKGGLHNLREISKDLPKVAVQKLMKEIGPRFVSRNGGYTRIIRTGEIRKDGARICLIEFV